VGTDTNESGSRACCAKLPAYLSSPLRAKLLARSPGNAKQAQVAAEPGVRRPAPAVPLSPAIGASTAGRWPLAPGNRDSERPRPAPRAVYIFLPVKRWALQPGLDAGGPMRL